MSSKPPLINEYEAYTEPGAELSDSFRKLISEFVKDACDKYDSTQVEYILNSTLSMETCVNRMKFAVNKRKEIYKMRTENEN